MNSVLRNTGINKFFVLSLIICSSAQAMMTTTNEDPKAGDEEIPSAREARYDYGRRRFYWGMPLDVNMGAVESKKPTEIELRRELQAQKAQGALEEAFATYSKLLMWDHFAVSDFKKYFALYLSIMSNLSPEKKQAFNAHYGEMVLNLAESNGQDEEELARIREVTANG